MGNINIEKFVLITQGLITGALFVCFMGLLGWSMFIANSSSEQMERIVISFLPIVTGWIGVVLGFYFSREVSKFLEDRLSSVKSETEEILEEHNRELEEANRKRKEDLDKTQKEFKEVISKKNKKIKELSGMTKRLLTRLETFRNFIHKRSK